MKNNKPLEVDIDSDILRALTFLDMLIEQHGFVERYKLKGKDAVLYNNFGYLLNVFNLVKEDKIRIVVNDAIFQESSHSKSLLKFIQKYCYCPNLNAYNRQRKLDEARKLAYTYCEPYSTPDGKTHNAPMKFVYFADSGKYAPTNDTYAAAQACRDGRCFITANGQDLIFDKKNYKENHDRSKGVVEINMLLHYYTEKADGSILVPRPMHIHTFGAILKDGTELVTLSSSFEELIKADTILTDEEIERLIAETFTNSSI